MAETDFLRTHLEPYLRSVVAVLKNPDGFVFHWTMVTLLRDALVLRSLVAVKISMLLNVP